MILVLALPTRAADLLDSVAWDWHQDGTYESSAGAGILAADFDGDGLDDVMTAGGQSFDDWGTTLHLAGFRNAVAGLADVPDYLDSAGAFSMDACDVNGDGLSELFQASRSYHSEYSLTQQTDIFGRADARPLDGLWAVCAGDTDGDGFNDVAVGSSSGREVHLYRGSPTGLSETPAWSLRSDAGIDSLGIHALGDVDGDGLSDLAITTRSESGRGYWSNIHLVYGPDRLARLRAPDATSVYYALIGAGDVDGDGYEDVLATNWAGGGAYQGTATVFAGGAGGLDMARSWQIQGDFPYAVLGYRAAALGDIDGDGFRDIALTLALNGRADPVETAAVALYRGSAAGPQRAPTQTIGGVDDYVGCQLHGGHDLTGDGTPDLLACAYPDASSAEAYASEARMYPGIPGDGAPATGEPWPALANAWTSEDPTLYWVDYTAPEDTGSTHDTGPITEDSDSGSGTDSRGGQETAEDPSGSLDPKNCGCAVGSREVGWSLALLAVAVFQRRRGVGRPGPRSPHTNKDRS